MKHLLLIDATGIAHRAFHAFPKGSYRDSDGLPNWALVGFISIMTHILQSAQGDPPTYGAAVFDPEGPTFRHELYPQYKDRPGRAEELKDQIPLMYHASEAMGILPVSVAGLEADDVIATLARRARRKKVRTTIVSSDKDFCQLVENGWIEIVDASSRERITEEQVLRKFGVAPNLVPDVQALWGDAVDCIPGVAGMGRETAAGVIRRYGNLTKFLAAALDVNRKEYLSPRVVVGVRRAGRENIQLFKKLATLRANATFKMELESLHTSPPEWEHIETFAKKTGIKDKLDAATGRNVKLSRPTEAHDDPFQWWRDALAIGDAKVQMTELPQCGFYERRLVRGGPFVPAKIWREAEIDFETEKPTGREVLKCRLGTQPADANAEWPRLFEQPITEEKYLERMGLKGADARKPVDFMTAPAPQFKKRKIA